METRIYFDMDGVLANFDRGVLELCGMMPVSQNDERPEGYDDMLWSHVREVPRFYDLLEPMPGAVELFQKVYRAFGNRCEILTGVPKPARGIVTAAEDKRSWVRRLLSQDVVVHTVLREEKKNYCRGRECVLIDDYGKNIKEWREAGGTAILYVNATDVLDRLRRYPEMREPGQ